MDADEPKHPDPVELDPHGSFGDEDDPAENTPGLRARLVRFALSLVLVIAVAVYLITPSYRAFVSTVVRPVWNRVSPFRPIPVAPHDASPRSYPS